MNRDQLSIPMLLLLVFATGGSAAQAYAADPAATYRAFLEARETARSLDEVAAFLPSAAVEQMKSAPPEMQERALASVTNPELAPPAGGFEVVAQSGDDSEVKLFLRGEEIDNGVRQIEQATVSMMREDDGWKIRRPGKWWTAGLLPTEVAADTAPRPVGVGAAPGDFAVGDYELVAEIEGGGDGETGVLFDPRGHFVMLTKQNVARQLALGGLEETWFARVYQSFLPAPTLSADGSALLVQGTGHAPTVVPLAPNYESTPAGAGYYSYQPTFPQVFDLLEEGGDSEGFAYHPQEAVLAVSFADFEDDSRGVILLQPTGDGLWRDGNAGEPVVWEAGPLGVDFVWAPTGEYLAWIAGYPDPGTAIRVKSYPDGDDVATLSSPDIQPGRLIFDAEGRRLATVGGANNEPAAVVWDLETGEQLAVMPGIGKAVFAPGGEHLLAVRPSSVMREAGVQDEILVWKIGESEPESVISAFPQGDDKFPHAITALGVSPNGRFLLAVNDEGDVKLWDAAAE